MIVYHSEAIYALRKYIIETLKPYVPELKSIPLNDVLGASAEITKKLEAQLDSEVEKSLGW